MVEDIPLGVPFSIQIKKRFTMNNAALGAENKKEQTINFISEAHEKLKEVRYQDVYHKALCYCR